ncbi:MAG: sulfotransferase [Pseudomonadota bacterium]
MLPAYQAVLDGDCSYRGTSASLLPDPIGVGAVGGSGTRLLLQILSQAGVAMASPLNEAGDAYEWPPWQKLLSPTMLAKHGRDTLLPNILHAFEGLLLARRENLGLAGRAGWKVPGTFHWLAELADFFPGFQYLHLVRNGMDMAYSGNQNQVKNWGPSLGVELRYVEDDSVAPQVMLEYWLRANERAREVAAERMNGRMLVIRFEDLCEEPRQEIARILGFLAIPAGESELDRLAGLVKSPSSVGRYRQKPWQDDFSSAQLERLAALGYVDHGLSPAV